MKSKLNIIQTIVTVLMFVCFVLSIRVLLSLANEVTSQTIIFNVSIGILALFGLAVLGLVTAIDKNQDEKSKWIFWGLILMTYLGVAFDVFSWGTDGKTEYALLNYILSAGSFFVIPVLLVLFWKYQNSTFGDQQESEKKMQFVIYTFFVADVIYRIIGCLAGYIFYIDEAGNYVESSGFFLTHIFPMFVIGCCFVDNLKKKLPIEKRIVLLSFVVMPVVIIVLSGIWVPYTFLYEAIFVELILVYGTVQAKKNVELMEQSMELVEQNLQIMISQIKPHFIYNTLAAIYQLCETDAKLAQQMTLDFSAYLRTNIDCMGEKLPISFEKELAHTKTYLAIELVRFSDILNVEYDIKVSDFTLPALTLQPLVENAVKYGVRSRDNGGTVTIATRRENGKIYISVHDDGMGFDVNEKKNDGKSHIGIENTRKRLELMMNAQLVIESQTGVGTTATIILES